MKEIPIRNYMGSRISEIWAPDENWRKKTEADVVTLHSFDNPPENLIKLLKPQSTYFSDLTVGKETLFSSIKKSFRYEINRNIKDDSVLVRVYSPDDLKKNKDIVEAFRKCYQEMYREKGIEVSLSDLQIFPFIEADAFWLSAVRNENEYLVFHSYIDCGDDVRLFQSCSCFRGQSELAALIGRSNKRLHWEDMLYFKEKGFKRYDWGGISSFDEPNGIDRFKLAFSTTVPPEKHIYYYGQVPITLKGKFMLKAYRLFRP